MLKEFNALFPKIDSSKYLRDQPGRIYSRLTTERQAGTYGADVLLQTDMTISLDAVQKGIYAKYLHPYVKDFQPGFQSNPAGYFTYNGMKIIGMSYNTNLVKEADAPKAWKDILDPKWRGSISTKDSASGDALMQWYLLRKLYGEQFWKDFAAQKPKPLAESRVIYERL
ncbi:MAG: extracellular solute-binding protein, partial [Dehalococcoidia bacterium]|nr:extracellular solute-binding protein [Dehalococcoidia bacterium]